MGGEDKHYKVGRKTSYKWSDCITLTNGQKQMGNSMGNRGKKPYLITCNSILSPSRDPAFRGLHFMANILRTGRPP